MFRQQGFTLIEVLIASTILFMVLATATVTYQTLVTSELRATNVVENHSILPVIRSSIHRQVRDNFDQSTLSGEGGLLEWSFTWEAIKIRESAPARRFDPDLNEFTSYEPRFAIYDVEVKLSFKGGKKESFKFKELTWSQDSSAVPVASR